MSPKAFLQAAFLSACLLAPAIGFLFLHAPKPSEPAQTPAPSQNLSPQDNLSPEPNLSPQDNLSPQEKASTWLGNDPFWSDLAPAHTPEELRRALKDFRQRLRRLPAAEATQHLLRLLDSGIDLPTGLPFSVGPGGILRSAPTLQATALDWLGQINPERAARRAHHQLTRHGTDLPPPHFTLHLRNFAWGNPRDPGDTRAFLRQQMQNLLEHQPWLQSPTPAVAEAFDVLVHSEATSLTPQILALLHPDYPKGIQAAALLSLERLVDRQPLRTLPAFLQQEVPPRQRAAHFARLHPGDPPARDLLLDYLLHPSVNRDESVSFLRYFPNLNQSFSHNLLSTNQLITDSVPLIQRLQTARDQVERWLDDPRLAHLQPQLLQTRQRLLNHLGENPPTKSD